MDIEMIRGIPIEEFLSRLGQEPVRRHGDECWYLSPCREERTPSFHVNTRKGPDFITFLRHHIAHNDNQRVT